MVMDTVDEAFFFSFVLPPSLPFSLSWKRAPNQRGVGTVSTICGGWSIRWWWCRRNGWSLDDRNRQLLCCSRLSVHIVAKGAVVHGGVGGLECSKTPVAAVPADNACHCQQ